MKKYSQKLSGKFLHSPLLKCFRKEKHFTKNQLCLSIHPVLLNFVFLTVKSKKKHIFFFKHFFSAEKASKKRIFCDIEDHCNLFDHQTTLKNIAWILYNNCIFGILKKSHKFVEIRGNTLIF